MWESVFKFRDLTKWFGRSALPQIKLRGSDISISFQLLICQSWFSLHIIRLEAKSSTWNSHMLENHNQRSSTRFIKGCLIPCNCWSKPLSHIICRLVHLVLAPRGKLGITVQLNMSVNYSTQLFKVACSG